MNSSRDRLVGAGIRIAQGVIDRNYGAGQGVVEKRLPFHGTKHTAGVVRRVGEIIEAINNQFPGRVSDNDAQVLTLAGAFHDSVIVSRIERQENGRLLRLRPSGQSEIGSAQMFESYLHRLNKEARDRVFELDEIALGRKAILHTQIEWNERWQTVVQNGIIEDTPLEERVLAWADLGTTGREPEAFVIENDRLFVEDNVIIDGEQFVELRSQFEDWKQRQIVFAKGREQVFKRYDVQGLSEEEREMVVGLMDQFPRTIELAEEAARDVQEMDSEGLHTYWNKMMGF